MKIIRVAVIVCIALLSQDLFSQSPARESKKKFSDMVGAWTIREVTSASGKSLPKDSTYIKWIEFTREGRYRSKTGSSLDSGSYRVNENHALLYLQSDADKNNPVQWKMDFGKGVMTLTVEDNPGAEEFRYVYVRTKADAKSLRK